MYTVITDHDFPGGGERAAGKITSVRRSKCARGVCGIVADTMLLECANPGYYAKLVQEYNQEGKTPDGVAGLDWGTVVNIQVLSGYAMSMVGNVITLGGGIAGSRGQSNSPVALSSPKIDFDAIEFGVTSFRDWVLVPTMVLTIYRLSTENHGSLEKAKILLASRDLCLAAQKLPAFMFTSTFFKYVEPDPRLYIAVGAARCSLSLAALGLHSAAEFGYLP